MKRLLTKTDTFALKAAIRAELRTNGITHAEIGRMLGYAKSTIDTVLGDNLSNSGIALRLAGVLGLPHPPASRPYRTDEMETHA